MERVCGAEIHTFIAQHLKKPRTRHEIKAFKVWFKEPHSPLHLEGVSHDTHTSMDHVAPLTPGRAHLLLESLAHPLNTK